MHFRLKGTGESVDSGPTDLVSGGKNVPLAVAGAVRRRRANEKEGKHEGEEEKEHTPLTDERTERERESEYIGVSVDFLLEQQ